MGKFTEVEDVVQIDDNGKLVKMTKVSMGIKTNLGTVLLENSTYIGNGITMENALNMLEEWYSSELDRIISGDKKI